MSINLKTKNIIVTGGSGFLSSFIVRKLRERGYKNIAREGDRHICNKGKGGRHCSYSEDYELCNSES